MEEVEYVNCTSHEIKVMDKMGNVYLDLPPDGKPARVEQRKNGTEIIGGVPVATEIEKKVKNLPEPKPGVMYIVSGFVKNVLADERDDLVSPDTAPQFTIRDEDGEIKGIMRLTK